MNPFNIMKASQISSCLEVSSFKPGNVNRYRDFDDVKFQHFICSGIGLGEVIYKASQDYKNLGYYILEGVKESKKWSPTNANLGIIILHIPLAMASGKLEKFSISELKRNLKTVIENTTVEDTLNFYKAVQLANPNIGRAKKGPDAFSDSAIKEILEKNLNLYDIFKISSEWDNISKEMVTNYKISFDGYKYINKYYKDNDIFTAIVKCYLKLLSENLDTLIIRKMGIEWAKIVSKKADEVLKNFSYDKVKEFDDFLAKKGNKLNTGTTADIVASSLMIFLLERIDNNKTIL